MMKLVNRMRFYVLFFSLFIVCATNSRGQAGPVDSLLQTVDHLQGEEKLDQLFELLVWQADSTFEKWAVISALEQEAIRQGSDKYIAKALWLKMVQATSDHTNTIPADSLLQMAEECIEAYSKADLYYGRTNVESVLFNYHISHGEYELALYRTQELMREVSNDLEEATACHHLGILYRYLNMKEEAIEILQKAILICEKHPTSCHRFRNVEIAAYSNLFAIYYNSNKEYESALQTGNKAIDLLMEGTPSTSWEKENLFLLNVHKYQALFTLKQYDEAAKLLELLEQEKDSFGLSENNAAALNGAYADYYMQSGAWDKALDMVDKVLAYHTKERSMADFITFSRQKAEILDSLHRHGQSSELKSEIIGLADSLTNNQTAGQLRQLESIIKIERLEVDKTQSMLKLEQTYILVACFALISLLLILFAIFTLRFANRLKEKNKRLFEQYKHISPEEIIVHTVDTETEPSNGEADGKRAIYNKAVEYLLATEKYAEVELSRETLALQIGTNRQYLIEAIQENAGMTYSEFLMQLRLEHARKLLLQDNNRTIGMIAQVSGFIDRSTFYRHFNSKYGMSPGEFRKLAEEDKGKTTS